MSFEEERDMEMREEAIMDNLLFRDFEFFKDKCVDRYADALGELKKFCSTHDWDFNVVVEEIKEVI